MLKQRDMSSNNFNNSNTSKSDSFGIVSKVIFVLVMLIALYYLYHFLFESSAMKGTIVLNTISPANPTTAYITPSAPTSVGSIVSVSTPTVPAIYEGGEFSINTWLYINDYSINNGQNKHVLELGGQSFSTLLLYLGPYKNSLSVRVQTASTISATGSATGASTVNLSKSAVATLFGSTLSMPADSSLVDANTPCDISTIDMQKWVQVTVVLNNKTCDVYIDGKLARSCILPSFYRIDKSTFQLSQCNYNGFGGFVSNTSVYNYSLNPEQVWRLYMAGPGPQYTLSQYIVSLFNPNSQMTFSYPKQNITG